MGEHDFETSISLCLSLNEEYVTTDLVYSLLARANSPAFF
jgi:hypothetical protein